MLAKLLPGSWLEQTRRVQRKGPSRGSPRDQRKVRFVVSFCAPIGRPKSLVARSASTERLSSGVVRIMASGKRVRSTFLLNNLRAEQLANLDNSLASARRRSTVLGGQNGGEPSAQIKAIRPSIWIATTTPGVILHPDPNSVLD